MSCNIKIPLQQIIDDVAAALSDGFIKTDNAILNEAVLNDVTLRGDITADTAARNALCRILQTCKITAVELEWLDRPELSGLVPISSINSEGAVSVMWTDLDALIIEGIVGKINAKDVRTADGGNQEDKNESFQKKLDDLPFEDGLLPDTAVIITPTLPGQVGRSLSDKLTESVSIKDFGAKGDGDQTLYPTDYYSDESSQKTRVLQQTADGLAINKAIVYLRSIGGGALYIPPAQVGQSYRVFEHLERIDFPCVIYGAGSTSVIKNCDNSPTNKNGGGIFVIQPTNYEVVGLMNFTVDGNADVREKPTLEYRQYPLAVYGKPNLMMYGVKSINSPIDCYMTSYDRNEKGVSVKAVNCHFENSYRNTCSLVSGDNQSYVNCHVSHGGYVHGGTQPRYTIDIEPNAIGRSIENIQFTNCYFGTAINVIVGGVWAAAQFSNCIFDGSIPHPSKLTDKGFPWLFQLTEGQWQLNNCKFLGRKDFMQNQSHHFNAYSAASKFNDSQYLKINNCHWENCGFSSSSRSVDIINCSAHNSLFPFYFQKGNASNFSDLRIDGLVLTNVFDGVNAGTGTTSAFSVSNGFNGNLDIRDVDVIVDQTSLKDMDKSLFTATAYHGVYIASGPSVTNKKIVRIKDVFVKGFYKILPAHIGVVGNDSKYRDWGSPNLPPADTAALTTVVTATLTDGTVTDGALINKSVTGTGVEKDTPANRVLGGRTTPYYKNCSMWGNFD